VLVFWSEFDSCTDVKKLLEWNGEKGRVGELALVLWSNFNCYTNVNKSSGWDGRRVDVGVLERVQVLYKCEAVLYWTFPERL